MKKKNLLKLHTVLKPDGSPFKSLLSSACPLASSQQRVPAAGATLQVPRGPPLSLLLTPIYIHCWLHSSTIHLHPYTSSQRRRKGFYLIDRFAPYKVTQIIKLRFTDML